MGSLGINIAFSKHLLHRSSNGIANGFTCRGSAFLSTSLSALVATHLSELMNGSATPQEIPARALRAAAKPSQHAANQFHFWCSASACHGSQRPKEDPVGPTDSSPQPKVHAGWRPSSGACPNRRPAVKAGKRLDLKRQQANFAKLCIRLDL